MVNKSFVSNNKQKINQFGQKKRSTLGPQLLQTIMDSVGMECDGAIRAKSKTRNWYYVQPHQNDDTYNNNDGIQLLVGVSTPQETTTSYSTFNSVDKVRIRIDRMDESIGQFALTLLDWFQGITIQWKNI